MGRYKRGMKVGGKHLWNYRIKSNNSSGNRISIYQTKGRNRPAPKGSGMPVGSKLHWGIKGKETYKKVKGGYLITLKGTKTQKGYTTKRKGKYIRPKSRNYLHKGALIESKEHNISYRKGRKIASDHIKELGNRYYPELIKMERRLKRR